MLIFFAFSCSNVLFRTQYDLERKWVKWVKLAIYFWCRAESIKGQGIIIGCKCESFKRRLHREFPKSWFSDIVIAYPPLNMGEDINFVLPCRQWSHSLVVPLVPSMMKGCCEKREWKGGKLTFEWTGNLASHPTIRTNQLQKTDTHLRAQKFIMLWIMDHALYNHVFKIFNEGYPF